MVVHSDAGAGADAVRRFRGEHWSLRDRHGCRRVLSDPGRDGRRRGRAGHGVDLGTIEAGKIADIAIVQGDVSRDLSLLGRVRDVLIAGIEVVRDGRIATSPPVRM